MGSGRFLSNYYFGGDYYLASVSAAALFIKDFRPR
jgi:hypothetical protein